MVLILVLVEAHQLVRPIPLGELEMMKLGESGPPCSTGKASCYCEVRAAEASSVIEAIATSKATMGSLQRLLLIQSLL